MTISWGNKIFILYTTFAISMIVLVYKCCQTNYDLVSANYYDEELAYQQLIDGSARSVEGGHTIQLKQVEQGVLISYGDFGKADDVSGECHFYFAPDASVDLKVPLNIGNDSTQFVSHNFQKGAYIVKLKWNANGHFYYQEKKLIIR